MLLLSSPSPAEATPANKAALERHYDKFLAKQLIRCTTCHLPSNNKSPENLDEFPHNPFGHRLRMLGKELRAQGKKADLPTRLKIIAQEDSDADGVANQIELLLGRNPGDARDAPTKKEMAEATKRHTAFDNFLASYRSDAANDADKFIRQAFLKILARHPNRQELRFCTDFLKATTDRRSAQLSTLNSEPSTAPTERARENLVLVLFNHNDLVTIR